MNTLFVLTHVPNPRINRRIKAVAELGRVEVACVRRSSQDVYEPALNDVPHHILEMDLPSSSKLLKRAISGLRFFCFALRKARQFCPGLLYVASLDSLIIARFYQRFHPKVSIVLEVADVREAYLREDGGLRRRLLSFLERRCYPNVQLLVLTSEKFYTHYYHHHFNRERVLVLPNLPDLSAFTTYRRKMDGPFTVGFIGGIRYLDQMKMLVDAADEAGVNVIFAGAGGTSEDMKVISSYCQGKGHVRFTGKYKYDQDIAMLYSSVDCVYAVYDANNPNVRIALPNKLYEAALCELPIIVADNTYLSEIVRDYNLGFSIDHKDVTALSDLLVHLKLEQAYGKGFNRTQGAVFLSMIQNDDNLKERIALLMKEKSVN